MNKTFLNIGIVFKYNADCPDCTSDFCFNEVTSKIDSKNYHLHISKVRDTDTFVINVKESTNTDSENDQDNLFNTEFEAVNFLCKNFEKFSCYQDN